MKGMASNVRFPQGRPIGNAGERGGVVIGSREGEVFVGGPQLWAMQKCSSAFQTLDLGLMTLIRPSHPVRHFCARLNQRRF